MLVVLIGDDLSVLLSACSLLQLSPTTRLLLALSPLPLNQQPWIITHLPATKHHITLGNAAIQRSASSLMFLDTVKQIKCHGRPDTLLIKPSPSFSQMMMYQPQALRQYLIRSIQDHYSLCDIMIMKGDLCKEILLRDLQRTGEPYQILDLSTSESLFKSRYNISQVHWIGMDHDLRLPQRAKVDAYDNVRIEDVGIKNGIKLISVGTAGQLQIAVKMSDYVVDLVGQRLMDETKWARL